MSSKENKISSVGQIDEFKVDTIKKIDPKKLLSGTNVDIENFILALSLAFNDLKDVLLFNELFLNAYRNPARSIGEEPEFSPHAGEYGGVRQHLFRHICATAYNILELVRNSDDVINTIKFRYMLKSLHQDNRRMWDAMVLVANNKSSDDDFVKLLTKVRHNVAFHFDIKSNGKNLRAGYESKFFSPRDITGRYACVSMGSDMPSTRFYFADAAVQQYIVDQASETDASTRLTEESLRDVVGNMNHAITAILRIYISQHS